jgi:hypothetical protein
LGKEKGKEKHIFKLAKGFFFLGFEFLICLFEHLLFSCTFVFPLQETQALPRVSGFAEGFLSGPRQRISLPSAALGTEELTALNPLPTVGPSAGRDPRQNHLFAESQPSARSAPSEKERAPSHLGCRPLCREPPPQLSAKALTRVYPG